MFKKFKKINKLNNSNNLNTNSNSTNYTNYTNYTNNTNSSNNDVNLRTAINNTHLQWNVFRDDFNRKQLIVFNIFDHGMFSDDIKDAMYNFIMNNISKNEFITKVDRETLYYFGSKVEYEIIISQVIGEDYYNKIDIRNQIHLNWDRFLDYLFDICNSLKCFADVKGFID